SAIWLAAAARILGGRVVSLEKDPAKVETWRRNVADAGLEEWAELVEGDARETLPAVGGSFDIVFIDAWKDDYEWYFAEARTKL
ncbi:O-methyltransferase, partial [Salmonella sp. SAL4447]|uniref:O-methyltransferase n=1 Tax=Salmonella sp. SAL4447 TaxID=3159902 RepID=UPI00397C02E5